MLSLYCCRNMCSLSSRASKLAIWGPNTSDGGIGKIKAVTRVIFYNTPGAIFIKNLKLRIVDLANQNIGYIRKSQ